MEKEEEKERKEGRRAEEKRKERKELMKERGREVESWADVGKGGG